MTHVWTIKSVYLSRDFGGRWKQQHNELGGAAVAEHDNTVNCPVEVVDERIIIYHLIGMVTLPSLYCFCGMILAVVLTGLHCSVHFQGLVLKLSSQFGNVPTILLIDSFYY